MSGTASLNGNLRRQGAGSGEPQCPPWMYNKDNQNPCQVAAQVLSLCDASISDNRIESSLLQKFSCPVKGENKACCCSTTTYALLSACLTCQNNNTEGEPSYRLFFDRARCPGGSAPSPTFSAGLQPQVDAIEVPLWAMIPPTNVDSTWDLNAAQKEAESEGLSPSSSNSGTSEVVTATSPAASSSSSSAQSSSTPTASTAESSSKKSPSGGVVAAAVLCSLALFCLLLCGAYFLRRHRRRLARRPSTIPRMDLADPGMEEKRASKPLDLLDGEEVERGASSSRPRSEFPFPFEWVVRRYHPNAPHSIEPSVDGEGELERERPREREARRVAPPAPALPLTAQNPPLAFPSIPEPAPAAITKSTKKDQLERDLAHLRGSEPTTSEDTSSSSAGKPKEKRRKSLLGNINELGKQATMALTGGSASASGSRSAPSDRDVYSAHSERRAEGKYYHLPPSAQFLANVARFPQRIDPERPWEVKGA